MIGSTLGTYEIVAEIGRGGMATVYKAYHAATDRHVAVKVIQIAVADNQEFLTRFEREAKLVAGLQHIHILPVFDYGQHEGTAYLVMPLIETGTLKRAMQAEKLDLRENVRIFAQIADAVGYAHEKGILHRDIKPDNVLLDDRNNVLLSDFGIARAAASTSNLTGDKLIGTPLYMSPEQGQGITVTRESDIYSLGVMLFEMLTGYVPYHADSPIAVIVQHVSGAIPSACEQNPNLPTAVDDVIEKALAKRPADRFESATEMAQALFAATQDALPTEISTSIAVSMSTSATAPTTPAPKPQHYNVFMSYSRTDTDMMHRITDSLRHAGLAVWTDEGIEAGSPSWKQALQTAIQDADCVVCVLSPDAAQSRWVREELDFADFHDKPIFLVHVRGEEREVILFGFSTSQRIDLRDQTAYDSNINSLNHAIRTRIGIDTAAQTTPASVVRQHRRGTYFYSNRFARTTINAMEDILGKAEVNGLLKLAELHPLVDNLPPDNDKKEFDFADFSALNAALGRTIWHRWWGRFKAQYRTGDIPLWPTTVWFNRQRDRTGDAGHSIETPLESWYTGNG